MADTTHLFTTVKNPLGHSRSYGYLGKHGRTLPAGARFTQFGDLIAALGVTNSATNKRKADALQRDLLNGKIELISTPAPILRDDMTFDIKALSLSAGALGTVDPSWGAYNDP